MKFIGKYSIQGKFASQLMMIVTATALVCLGCISWRGRNCVYESNCLCLECVELDKAKVKKKKKVSFKNFKKGIPFKCLPRF